MKIPSFYFLLILLSCQGCLPVEDSSKIISFWTDSNLDPEIEYTLYINDNDVGKVSNNFETVVCGTHGLVNIDILDDSDMYLEIRSSIGEIKDIGIINLSSPATGIMVKPNVEDTIYVTHGIDDPCTLVRLRW